MSSFFGKKGREHLGLLFGTTTKCLEDGLCSRSLRLRLQEKGRAHASLAGLKYCSCSLRHRASLGHSGCLAGLCTSGFWACLCSAHSSQEGFVPRKALLYPVSTPCFFHLRALQTEVLTVWAPFAQSFCPRAIPICLTLRKHSLTG